MYMVNRTKKSTDYRVRDKVLILAGDYKDKIGTVQGHDGNLLIVSFDKESEFKGIHFMNVTKLVGM